MNAKTVAYASGEQAEVHASRTTLSLHTILNLRSIGFALIRAWVYLLFLDVTWSFTTSGNISWLPSTYFVSTLTLSATLFLCAIFHKQAAALLSSRSMYVVAPLLTALGTALILASSLPGAPAEALCLAGGIFTGVGSGLIDLGYGTLYRTEEPRNTTFEVPFAFFLAAAIFAASLLLPDAGIGAICTLLPLASGVILLKCIEQQEIDVPLEAGTGDIAIAPFAWRIGVCACLVGVGDMLVRTACFADAAASTSSIYQVPLLLASILTMALIYACAAIAPSGTGVRRVYRYVVFVMAAFYMLLPLISTTGLPEATIALTGYGTFNVLIWLLLAETAYRHKLRGTTIFGIGWGMVTVGVMLGNLAGRIVMANAPLSTYELSIVAFVATVAIVASYLFVLKESDLEKMVTPAPQGVEAMVDALEDEGDAAGLRARGKLEGSAQAEATPRESATPNGAAGSDAAEGAAALAGPEGPGGLAAEDASRMDGEEPRPHRMRFLDACDALSQEFGLSPKETEVMILYAKGYTSKNIQEELFLSRGTVTTHLRHIYQKLDIHSKQELVALVERRRG